MRGGRSKMRGGNPESTYTTTEVISIILLIIALVLGLMFYFRKTNKQSSRAIFMDSSSL